MTRMTIVRTVLVACLCLWSGSARADDAAQARFFDQLARRHYAAGEYREALRAFFEEQRLAPNPRIAFNIALCFERLDEKASAYTYYVEYLGSRDEDPTRRQYAEVARNRLGKTISRVKVTSSPPGAEIFVDDETYGSYGRTPREIVVEPGRHQISLRLRGYRPASRQFDVAKGRGLEAEFALEPMQGTLQVESTPVATAQIRDTEGRTVAEGPTPFTRDLPEGVYVLSLTAPQHQSVEGVVRIKTDETVEQTYSLAALEARTAEVVFTSNVTGALVEVDGEPVGFAPVVSKLPEGEHSLRISHPDRAPYASQLDVRPDKRAWLTAQLEPPALTKRSPYAWVSGGLGAALLVAGAAVGVAANDRRADFENAQAARSEDVLAIRDEGQTLNIAADTLLVTGAVALAIGVVLYFVTEEEVATPSSATVAWESE